MGLYDRDYMRDTGDVRPRPHRKRRWFVLIAIVALAIYLASIF